VKLCLSRHLSAHPHNYRSHQCRVQLHPLGPTYVERSVRRNRGSRLKSNGTSTIVKMSRNSTEHPLRRTERSSKYVGPKWMELYAALVATVIVWVCPTVTGQTRVFQLQFNNNILVNAMARRFYLKKMDPIVVSKAEGIVKLSCLRGGPKRVVNGVSWC